VLVRLLILSVGVSFACAAIAQSNIAELIEQTGIEAGDVVLRDLPGWRKPEKIVTRDMGIPAGDFQELMPGVEVIVARSEAEAVANAKDADAIVGWCSERVISAAEAAIWVQIFTAGAERCLTVDKVASGSIVLTNMQKMSSPVIAEHLIAMTLSLARRIPQFARTMPSGEWRRTTEITDSMQSVAGKTMLVVGLGGIGTEVARRAAALDMRVIGTRRSSREGPEFVDYVGLSNELLELAAEADFIADTLPLTAETAGLLDKEFFDAAKRGAHECGPRSNGRHGRSGRRPGERPDRGSRIGCNGPRTVAGGSSTLADGKRHHLSACGGAWRKPGKTRHPAKGEPEALRGRRCAVERSGF